MVVVWWCVSKLNIVFLPLGFPLTLFGGVSPNYWWPVVSVVFFLYFDLFSGLSPTAGLLVPFFHEDMKLVSHALLLLSLKLHASPEQH